MAAPTLRELLEIENEPLFAESVCPATGIAVWPAIRDVFFQVIVSEWLYPSQPLITSAPKHPALKVGALALRALIHNRLQRPRPCSTLIYATGAGVYEVNGRSRNRHTHGFREVLAGDCWSLEGLAGHQYPPPREGGRLSFSLPGRSVVELATRLRTAPWARRSAEELVTRAVARAGSLFGWRPAAGRRAWLIRYCARKITGYPWRRDWFARWLDRIRPTLLLVEEGCYGHMAVLNATARERGVTIAEFQHGMVTSGHYVYNVAPVLERSPEFRRTQPDYFLGYGAWWNRQFNAPPVKVVIGNPHRMAALRALSGRQDRIVLVLGDGYETSAYLAACSKLADLISPDFRVVFRPHPLERSRVSITGTGSAFEIDDRAEILASLARADAVVGEVSTGLFDAVGLARRVFVWDTPKSRFGLPQHPFPAFATLEELAQMIRQTEAAGVLSSSDVEQIWAPDWQERFRGFVTARGIEIGGAVREQ